MQSNQDKLTNYDDDYEYGTETISMLDVRMAIRKRYPNKNHDWLAYQWQRAIDNVENGELMPSWHAPSNYLADKRLALGLLLNVFGTDIHGNEINED